MPMVIKLAKIHFWVISRLRSSTRWLRCQKSWESRDGKFAAHFKALILNLSRAEAVFTQLESSLHNWTGRHPISKTNWPIMVLTSLKRGQVVGDRTSLSLPISAYLLTPLLSSHTLRHPSKDWVAPMGAAPPQVRITALRAYWFKGKQTGSAMRLVSEMAKRFNKQFWSEFTHSWNSKDWQSPGHAPWLALLGKHSQLAALICSRQQSKSPHLSARSVTIRLQTEITFVPPRKTISPGAKCD